MFTIEKNIPIIAANPRSKYPFDKMEVGDSFVVSNNAGVARAAAFSYGKFNNKKFKTRTVETGTVRIWRVE